MAGILAGKKILVVGVTHTTSLGYAVAQLAQQEGATVVVANYGRAMRLTAKVLQRLDPVPALIELDVTQESHLKRLPELLGEHIDGLDGIVHAVAYANPDTALGGQFLQTPWSDVAETLQVSAYSLASVTAACRGLLRPQASIVGLTFDGSLSWPNYDWMGVAKAALEGTARQLARDLGSEKIRVNLVSAGPVNTLAKNAIPGAEVLDQVWAEKAPLGWDPNDATAVARAVCALLSDWFVATTGEIIHVDGGFHAMGM
ncbi:MAG: enoyl-ACP reductase FabI [Propionibacteriaceae bacterium]